MPATTKGLPYPSGTDDPDVPDDMRLLALAVDARLARAHVVGAVSVSATASPTGSAVVTFPAGTFTAAPRVVVSPEGSGQLLCYATAITATGFTAAFRQVANSNVTLTIPVHYFAEVMA